MVWHRCFIYLHRHRCLHSWFSNTFSKGTWNKIELIECVQKLRCLWFDKWYKENGRKSYGLQYTELWKIVIYRINHIFILWQKFNIFWFGPFCLRNQVFSCRLSLYMILGTLLFLSIILLRMFLFPNSPEANCKRQTLRDTQTPLSGFLQFIVTEL